MIFLFRSLFLILGLSLSSFLSSIEYGIFAKKAGTVPITKFAIYSERCSGSNYIQSLVIQNFKISYEQFCSKHFPPWFELPSSYYLGDQRNYTFENTEDYLFIVIFRNPYDWVRSFYCIPHYSSWKLKRMDFSNFIRAPWDLDYSHPVVQRQTIFNPWMDHNPANGSLFNNVFKLREAKIRTMLKIKKLAKNSYYVNYETARDHPQEVLKEMETIFKIESKPIYEPVTYYKGNENHGVYKQKKYESLSPQDLKYINSQLNKMLEKTIGYDLLDTPNELE